MADTTTQTARTPRHLWVVGVIAVLWNSMGAMDFTMSNLKAEAYLKAFTPEQIAYFTGFPLWAVLVWGMGTWGGFLGSLLLLFRRGFAVNLFAVSLVGAALTDLYCYGLSNGLKVMGANATGTVIFSAVIFVVAVLLFVYARKLRLRGVLR